MRRAKSLRIGVHLANGLVWGLVYRTHLRRGSDLARERLAPASAEKIRQFLDPPRARDVHPLRDVHAVAAAGTVERVVHASLLARVEEHDRLLVLRRGDDARAEDGLRAIDGEVEVGSLRRARGVAEAGDARGRGVEHRDGRVDDEHEGFAVGLGERNGRTTRDVRRVRAVPR